MVQIGTDVKLPTTIREFLTEMAAKQGDEIRQLKAEALSGKSSTAAASSPGTDRLVPDPWQLHPVIARKPKNEAQKKGRDKRLGR